MKCETCHENESIFFYRSTVNGKTTESHLCASCAQEVGLLQPISLGQELFADFFSTPFSAPLRASSSGNPLSNVRLFPFFESIPAPICSSPNQIPAEPAAREIPTDAGERIRKKRELCALRHQLRAAVRDEEFEKAIELRDAIRAREA